MAISAEGLNEVVEFSPGGSNVAFISIAITDDDVQQEAIEMYIASFEIVFSDDNVQPGNISMTLISILNDDGMLHKEVYIQ